MLKDKPRGRHFAHILYQCMVQVMAYILPIQLPVNIHPKKQNMMAQVSGFPATSMTDPGGVQVTDCSLIQPIGTGHLGNKLVDGRSPF